MLLCYTDEFSKFMHLRFPLSDEGKRAEINTSASASASVPNFFAVYTINRYYPGNSVIACLVENSNDTLLTHLVPSNLHNPTFKGKFKPHLNLCP